MYCFGLVLRANPETKTLCPLCLCGFSLDFVSFMTEFFQFEADFVDSLRCIPMVVRMKLDTSGVKLKLSHWNQLSQEERQQLVSLPCDTPNEIESYFQYLQNLIQETTGATPSLLPREDKPAWLNPAQIPALTQEKANQLGITITPEQWYALTPSQRFALIKLSRPGHESKNFLPALKEFAIVQN